MYNPFPLLNEGLLKDQVGKGKRYFVRQTFVRGMEGRLKAAFLLRGYDAGEKGLAEAHMAVIAGDVHAFLYDADDPALLERLQIAAHQPFGYKVYYAAKRGLDWKPPQLYQDKIRRYLNRHHGDWRSTRGGAQIQAGLYEEFGALFIKFSYEGEEDVIPFDDIEKY